MILTEYIIGYRNILEFKTEFYEDCPNLIITSNAKPNSFSWVSMFFVYKVSWHYGWNKDEAGHRKGLTDAIFSAAWDVAGTACKDTIGPFTEVASKGKGIKIVFA